MVMVVQIKMLFITYHFSKTSVDENSKELNHFGLIFIQGYTIVPIRTLNICLGHMNI